MSVGVTPPPHMDTAWKKDAACVGMNQDLFFLDKGANGTRARRVCGGCPVQPECLEYALVTHPPYGIFGGFTYRERQNLRLGRPAARSA